MYECIRVCINVRVVDMYEGAQVYACTRMTIYKICVELKFSGILFCFGGNSVREILFRGMFGDSVQRNFVLPSTEESILIAPAIYCRLIYAKSV